MARHAGPFETHVREAIALNRRRSRLYASMTEGQSNIVFRRYIAAERLTLPAAIWFDRAAAPYEHAGVPLLSAVFEPMSSAPAMHMNVLPPRQSDDWSPNAGRMAHSLASAFRRNRFAGVSALADELLNELAVRPWRDCMLRHQVESVLRLSNVSPRNIRQAVESRMESPERLLRRLFWFHLQGVRLAPWLDKPALRLQLLGIPILENDLPSISPWPNEESLRQR